MFLKLLLSIHIIIYRKCILKQGQFIGTSNSILSNCSQWKKSFELHFIMLHNFENNEIYTDLGNGLRLNNEKNSFYFLYIKFDNT